mmetsp:Transcript_16364/g.38743  ORF Transcript_16364/g.38743 Transcript_16364/m.38743 type:complete len:992 (+) Transcript_16364:114-3089(+)
MSREIVSSEGIYVAGSFQDWRANETELLSPNGDDVFEVTLDLTPGFHEFKFINSNTWENVEEVPYGCSEQQSGHFNRFILIPDDTTEVEMHVCFSACVPCSDIQPCKLFTCPSWMLHRPSALELVATTTDECCEDGSADVMEVIVRSAGWSDGNEASFWLNSKKLFSTSARGLTAVALGVDGEVQGAFQTFDTNQESAGFEDFLNGLASNTTVLLGASDEASSGLSESAKALIQACGGQQVGSLGFRGSYALIGVKHGIAYAESLSSAGDGLAVAVGVLPQVQLPLQAHVPCDASTSIPPTRGKLHSTGNLEVYTEGGKCRYPVFEPKSIGECLSGSWIVVMGTSNAQLMANALLFMLSHEEAIPYIDFGTYNLLDFVIDDGQIVYYNAVDYSVKTCSQNSTGLTAQEQRCKEIYADELAKAPAPTSTGVRVTMAISFFWERVRSIMDIVEADVGWKDAKVGYLAQVVAWYLVCQNIKYYLCPRTELKSDTEDETFAKFTNEMESVLGYMETSCAPTGRAGQGFGCVVATNSFTEAAGSLLNAFLRFNQRVMDSMATRAQPTFRALDIFEVGASMPGETIAGHGSQVLHLWVWTMILGGWCPASYRADTWKVSFVGSLCWADHADFSLCPRVSYGVEWHCINSIPCVMDAVDEISTTSAPSTVAVTLHVDMRKEVVTERGVHVAGSFQGWDPSATQMSDSDADGTYEVTVMLLPGFYEFKFINGDSWDGVEAVPEQCQEAGSGHSNRYLPVSAAGTVHVCFGGCGPCENLPTSTLPRTTATFTSTTSSTSSSSAVQFEFTPVGGGLGRACRGSSSGDNKVEYYTVRSVASLSACKTECQVTSDCVGVEYSTGRCEVWTRKEGIQASISLTGFVCYRYQEITRTTTGSPLPAVFAPVDGGADRACRGANAGDNFASYYTVIKPPVQSLQDCQDECLADMACVGIEFSLGRCEVWNRTGGIESSVHLNNFTCMRKTLGAAPRRLSQFLARGKE